MKGLDTNILVRYLMQDDPTQSAAAEAVLREPCYIADTVLLELAWVLSSAFRLDRARLAAVLARVIELPGVVVAERSLVTWAIGRFAAGADFADMMHLVASRSAERFASFDRALAGQAADGTPVPIDTLA